MPLTCQDTFTCGWSVRMVKRLARISFQTAAFASQCALPTTVSWYRTFRYQLTVVGKAHWEAKAAVWNEIRANRFTIRTDQPQVKVSWQVSGIRHDRYAKAHPVQVAVPKAKAAQGKYLHPELYGKPKRDAIGYQK